MNLHAYTAGKPTRYSDPLGLRPPKTDNEQLIWDACKGDPACETSVGGLFDIFDDTPPPSWIGDYGDRIKYGGSCVLWRVRVNTKFVDDRVCGKFKGFKCKIIEKKYHGWRVWWDQHHWLQFVLPNGFSFYADDGTLGECDHIFFDFCGNTFRDDRERDQSIIDMYAPY